MTEIKPPPKPATREAKPPTREERLAARLRDNLRLRKAQARALSEPSSPDPAGGESPS
jgi:hypothetical protein